MTIKYHRKPRNCAKVDKHHLSSDEMQVRAMGKPMTRTAAVIVILSIEQVLILHSYPLQYVVITGPSAVMVIFKQERVVDPI